MADQDLLHESLEGAIIEALGQLLTVQHTPAGSYVHLPMFHPSGAAATVLVTRDGADFRVSDAGFAYREAELVGGERGFSRHARKVARDLGLEVSSRSISTRATRLQLAATIADVGSASMTVASEIVSQLAGGAESELVVHLQERLTELFGTPNIDLNPTVPGASSQQWDVSAVVHADQRNIVFDAVSNHHTSVYATATKFHDISRVENPPVTVSVVHRIDDMGNLYNLLAQAGHVLQEDAPNKAFQLAATA